MIRLLRRNLPVFLGVVLTVLVLGAAIGLVRRPLYTATAEAVVQFPGAPVAPAAGDTYLASQIRILRSGEVARKVFASLTPESRRALATPDGLWAEIRGMVGLSGTAPTGSEGMERAIVERLTRNLSVDRVTGTYSIQINHTDADPAVAAAIANIYANIFAHGDRRGAAMDTGIFGNAFIRLISRAESPSSPSTAGLWLVLAFSLVIGLSLGVAAAAVAERRSSGLTGGLDVSSRLGLLHIGSVPTLRSVLPNATSPVTAVIEAPMSGFAEAFRSIMVAVRHTDGKDAQVIAITSALPSEGKSTLAACLARSVALSGSSVVLVDCDSQRRDVSRMLGASGAGIGLAEVLRDSATLDEALVRDEASGAWILPLIGPPEELSNFIGGPAMNELIAKLRERFSLILIDTAPIMPISATRSLLTIVDSVILVVRWRKTSSHAVSTALGLLPAGRIRLAGVVLCQVDMKKQARFGSGDQTYYYQQYSQYYS